MALAYHESPICGIKFGKRARVIIPLGEAPNEVAERAQGGLSRGLHALPKQYVGG